MDTIMNTFTASGPIAATIELGGRGDVSIMATTGRDVLVDITARNTSRHLDQAAAEQAIVEFAADRLTVRFKPWRRYSWFSDGGAIVVSITLPLTSRVEVSSGMGDIHADGQFSELSLTTGMGEISADICATLRAKTGMGDITVTEADGGTDLATGSGTVRVGDLHGPGTITNANGTIFIADVTGDLHVKASNGDVLIDSAKADVNIKSTNGAVRVASVSAGTTTITSSGSIGIGVEPDTPTWLDLHSRHGNVHCDLTDAPAPDRTGKTLQVRAHSSFGNVSVYPTRSTS